jgi:hypothetical protein
MGVTTRAAAQRKAQAEAKNLLDLPDSLLERILLAASSGGQLRQLRSARRACSRLYTAADAAARALTARVGTRGGRYALQMLPRLGALTRLQLEPCYGLADMYVGLRERRMLDVLWKAECAAYDVCT